MLQLLLLPVNKNGNHCHSVSKCCPHNVDASSNQDLWQHMKMGNGQFSPLDQINGTVKMSKRYKYLWCACQFSCLAQVQCLLIENFDIKFYLRPSLRTWGRRFPWLLWAWTLATFRGNEGKLNYEISNCSYSLPTIFFWQLEILDTAMPYARLSLLANFSCQAQQFDYNVQH